ncbi:hypothetical protein GJW-30_1_03629 [Variibacter gotjawalensis]|uniref:Uncharacterized protein n=1 Tax=Variibacter gotjawalensis TaxID=1333996 RepID=A0A0S3PYR2_9BRAD|nr:YihY/virulence factor BrkB family protein [Variibacter gotjawalensis]NIK46916.1 membrane protein [Variibacter gotjawalensis]RZS48820.1 membrane protein [Variibacter gotjawalensis]BAT61079.1 hypothetical protein GJW-30_1_03629 [Variibacter gotjawalensis]
MRLPPLLDSTYAVLQSAVFAYVKNEGLSRGAAIAFYAATSLSPVLLIVIAIAGAVFGDEIVRASISAQLSGLIGPSGGEFIRAIVGAAQDKSSGAVATALGFLAVIVTASGAFSEMQAALNKTWGVTSPREPLLSLLRTRAVSLGLVAALAFILVASLAASAALTAMQTYVGDALQLASLFWSVINTLLSLAIFTLLFAAIYKVLPDFPIEWRDVLTGALLTALMFTIGKSLIGFYLGRFAGTSSYGAAGALVVLMLWMYYSAQIFLFGAEVTRAISQRRDERRAAAKL